MESAGTSWAARALSLAPSLIEELYPEFARLRREGETTPRSAAPAEQAQAQGP